MCGRAGAHGAADRGPGDYGVERVRSHEEIECERTGAERCPRDHPAKRPFSQASVATPEKTSGAERLHYPPPSGVPFFKTRKSSFEEQRHGAGSGGTIWGAVDRSSAEVRSRGPGHGGGKTSCVGPQCPGPIRSLRRIGPGHAGPEQLFRLGATSGSRGHGASKLCGIESGASADGPERRRNEGLCR